MKRTLAGLALVLLVLALIGCAAATVTSKKMVDVAYKGTLADGSVFSQSEAASRWSFSSAGGMLVPALEIGMMGMKVGEKSSLW